MIITCNISLEELLNLEPEEQFTITNDKGATLACEFGEFEGEPLAMVMMDTFISGCIDSFTDEIARMSNQAIFMQALATYLKGEGQEVLTDVEAVDGAHEDPYIVLYIDWDLFITMLNKHTVDKVIPELDPTFNSNPGGVKKLIADLRAEVEEFQPETDNEMALITKSIQELAIDMQQEWDDQPK